MTIIPSAQRVSSPPEALRLTRAGARREALVQSLWPLQAEAVGTQSPTLEPPAQVARGRDTRAVCVDMPGKGWVSWEGMVWRWAWGW